VRHFGQTRSTFGASWLPSWLIWDGGEKEGPHEVGGQCWNPKTDKVEPCATVAQREGYLGPGTNVPYEPVDDFDVSDLNPFADPPPPTEPPPKASVPLWLPIGLLAGVAALGVVYFKSKAPQ
jgi:hypothetical protein